MFRFFFKARAPRTRQPRRRNNLSGTLETLEGRLCLSDLPPNLNPDLPPSLTINVAEAPGNMATISGQVTDENPAGVVITFGGVVGGSTSPDSSGAYSVTAAASALGAISAVAVDEGGQSSGLVAADLTSMPPTISLSLSYGEQRWVTLSGTVSDEVPGGLTVTFTGMVNSSITTNANGSFALTVQASALGDINASTADQWGLMSNTATVTVTSNAPDIVGFGGTETAFGNNWVFTGTVSDESPVGLVVTFGGYLAGHTATVLSNGSFILVVSIPGHVNETATAQVTDWWGLTSEIVFTLVQST